MTHIITLVGDLGGGKTTLAKVMGMMVKWQYPDALVVSNVQMGNGIIKVDDVHKFMALKLIKKDKTYACVIDDEAAQAGLESRGSGSRASAIEARIITHARKAHVDLILISQLKSMLDKRAQWVEDFAILCEAKFTEGNMGSMPDGFHHTQYSKDLEVMNEFDLSSIDMLRWVWPGMDTDDIPFFGAFKAQFMSYYSITQSDEAEFDKVMGSAPTIFPPQGTPVNTRTWQSRKGLKVPNRWGPGDQVEIDGKLWEVQGRHWVDKENCWEHDLREVS